ncbi:MAG: GGDEF domain-containing protein [Clostridia bacterium]|nr:GGDEF domain-containing protein [Clostridia bacterium]
MCFIILAAIAYQSENNVNQQMRRVLFRYTVYGIMCTLVLDTVWIAIDGLQFPGGVIVNKVVNAVYLPLGVGLGCLWYLYVLETLGYRITKRLMFIVALPAMLSAALNLASMWTGWIFDVTPDNYYVRGPLFWLQTITALGMLLASLLHILLKMRVRSDDAYHTTVKKLLGFYIIPVVGTLAALPFAGMPGTWTCAAISIVLIYMDDQDREILRDSLTGLNNRKTLDAAFADYVRQDGEGRGLYLFMLDLDDFKGINDAYGHPEGDRALVLTARVLTGAMAGARGIVARFGGDEFLIMGFFDGDPAAAGFVELLRRNFVQCNREHRLPYRLDASIGWERYAAGESLPQFIKRADAALYADKQRRRRIAS